MPYAGSLCTCRTGDSLQVLLTVSARRFLHGSEQYGLLSGSTKAAFGRVESGEREDSTTARDAKVAQFKRCASRYRLVAHMARNNIRLNSPPVYQHWG